MAAKKKKKPANQPKKQKQNKPHGHFCWVCGEHKANEKFSGRGHATHMCKQCHALPVAERNKMVALRKIGGMEFRYLNEQEIKWLRKRMNDARPEVKEAACQVHAAKIPRIERNMRKKGLTAFSLEFFIRGEVWNEWGDETDVHTRVIMDRNGLIRRTDYAAPEDDRESEVTIDKAEARKFLKAVIHQLDALFWDEDLSDSGSEDYDPYLDILPEYRPDYDDEEEDDDDEDGEDEASEPEAPAEDREPIWSLLLELNNGEDKSITFYNQMHDEPQELFRLLMEWFEPDEDESEEGGDENEI